MESYLKKIDGTDGTDPMKALTAETSEIVKDLKEHFAEDENVQAIVKTLETATDASKISTFYADRESIINDTGKGVNNSYRAAGTISYAGGTAQASIDVGAAPKITVKESLTVDAKNNTNIFNLAGGLSTSSGNKSSNDSSNNSSNKLMSYSANNLTADSVNTLAADDSEEPKSSGIELLDRIRDFVDSDIYETVSEVFKHFNDAKSTITDTKDKIDKAIDEKVSAVTGSKPDDVNINKTDELSSQESQPKVTFDGAGALNFRGADSGKTSVALTGAVAVNKVDSNVIADISANKNLTGAINNTAEKSGALNNIVSTTLTDVAGGVGVSVAQGSESSYGFQGVFTYNKVINNSHADIKNADITADSLINSSSDDKNAAKAYDQTLTGAGLDVSGDSYSEFAKVGETDSTEKSIENQSAGAEGVEADESVGYKTGDYGNKIITAALAVAGAGDGAAQASLAISDVDNDFKSEVTSSNLNITNKTDINATSNTLDINAAAGAAVSSKGFGVGGSVAYNDVGTSDNQQLTKITMAGNEITASENISVNAKDTSDLLTVGVGIGGSGKVAVQGSAAVATLNKDVGISLDDSTIKANTVSFKAKTAEDLITTADVLSIGGQVAVGAGVSVNNDYTKTGVAINNSTLTTDNSFNADSSNASKVLTIGIGGEAGGTAGVTGSVAVNNLDTNTVNNFDGATINASNGVLINAKGDESIANYAGTISASGSGAAVGLSVSVNNINSNVKNTVNNSNFDKIAGGSFTVDDFISKDSLLSTFVEGKTFNPSDNLASHRVNNTYKGVIIDANATHDIKSALFNVGVAGSGAAINGTVNVNRINGATSSDVKNTGFNIDSDINILANDFSNAAGLVGTASAAGTGAGVGLSVDVLSLNKVLRDKGLDGDNLKSGGMNIELLSDADKQVTAGGAENSGTHINISGAMNADKISVNNAGTNNLTQGLFTGSVGGISVNGAVGILNLQRNASTDITGNLTAKDLTINNQDSGTSNQEIMQGGFGLAAAANVSHGALNVTGTNKIKIDGNTLDTTTLKISNSDDSKVNVNSKGVTASATFAGSGLFAGSINDSTAKIFGDGATFTGDSLNINAENLSTVKTTTNSASGSLLASGSLTGILNNSNAAAAVDFKNATVSAQNTAFNVNSSPEQKVGLVSLGAGGLLAATGSIAAVTGSPSATVNMSAKEISADNLKMTATADSNPEISVKGLTAGAIASGSNLIISARDLKVDASLNADSATLNDLNIDAKTDSAPNLNVNGDGGGLVGVAPLAAVLEDNLTQANSVNLGGTLNVKNSVNVNAKNSDAGTYTADALGAAVIGASGVKLSRSNDSNAAINFNNANIKTEGSQTYNAINNLDYSLDLATEGNNSAIKLAASDNTEQKYHTIANIQGGFAGIGVANTANTLNRANSIKLNNSTIDTANNAYLNSGYNFEDVPSKLVMTAFADVYNKTAIPLSNAPKLKNDLKINNTVDINSGSTINAVRNVNINAESGTEVVTESAKEYNIYNGTDGKGNVIVTTGHEGNAFETANNYVNIDGTINTGIRNSLKMTISGGKFSARESETENPTVTVTEGADIFDPSKINFSATATMDNPFLADYNKALSDMQAYTPNSAEYNSLYNQLIGIERLMATYGFAEKMSGTDQYVVYDKIQIPAMELPDIALAGGNIDINTPTLKGNGTLNANAAKDLTIDNKTDRSLLINNLTMDNAGGRVYLNDLSTTASGNLKFNTQSDYTPAIIINNTGNALKIESAEGPFRTCRHFFLV